MAQRESTANGPEPEPGILASRRAMAIRLVAVAVTLLLVLVVAYVVVILSGPPTVDELRDRAGLNGKRELLVGVKDDQPGIALRDPKGTWSGFDIDIAYLIAEELDFRRSEVRFLAIESEDRARMQAVDTTGRRVGVDLVIASYSITAAREAMAGVSFSAPYLFTEQSVVTLSDHEPVSTLEDLRGRRVCSLATATSEGAAQRAGVAVVSRKKISECFTALDRGIVEAVSTDAAILAGFVARQRTTYTHHDIGLDATEAWGVNVGENDALRDLVNLALYRSRNDAKDARWEEAFDRNLRSEEPAESTASIAVDQQPKVPEVAVRQWPWERVG
jgi:glutamate transport system substrate-binding protein